jgi:hypothetical protein
MKQRRAHWWETSAATKAHTSTYRLDGGEPGARRGDRSSRGDRRRVADGRIPAWSTEAISKGFSASSPSGSAAASCVRSHLRHGCAAVASSGEQIEDEATWFFLQPLFPPIILVM